MKINDIITINPGLDVYQTVSAATAATAAAKNSRGIGQITQFDGQWIRIKWLREYKGFKYWWYEKKAIKKNFHVIKNKAIINILYGKVVNA